MKTLSIYFVGATIKMAVESAEEEGWHRTMDEIMTERFVDCPRPKLIGIGKHQELKFHTGNLIGFSILDTPSTDGEKLMGILSAFIEEQRNHGIDGDEWKGGNE